MSEALILQLRANQAKFDFYGREHRSKAQKAYETDRHLAGDMKFIGGRASDQKAEVNEKMVSDIEDTIQKFYAEERNPANHELKVHPQFWPGIKDGSKPFEVRLNDRKYRVGDKLKLREYDPSMGYTGAVVYVPVTYVLHHEDFPNGVPTGYVVLGLGKFHTELEVQLMERNDDLLAANNAEVERRRAAERELRDLKTRLQDDGK